MLKPEILQQLAEDSLNYAKKLGATQCAISLGCDQGLQLCVRLGKLDQLEFHNSHTGSVEVYQGKSKASVRTNQLDASSLFEAIDTAYVAAKCAAKDEYAGLAGTADWAKEFLDLKTSFPYSLDPDAALQLAIACEQTGLASDKQLVNSEGAECSGSNSLDCLALYSGEGNSFFNQLETGSSYSLGCALIGQGKDQQQVGYWYDTNLDFNQLSSPEQIGKKAAENTLAKLNARSVSSGNFPVLFDPEMARGYWRMLTSGIRGSALYRKSTLLNDKLGEDLFPKWLNLREQPHLVSYPGSANYDSDGVATRSKLLIEGGTLANYLLDSYSARKLKMQTTGNAGTTTNLLVEGQAKSFYELVADMGKGLIVRDTMGSGLNLLTGDFSIGASGQWVENGQIVHPVQLVTISGNMLDMFSGLVQLGSDVDPRFALRTGSVLLEGMTLGGSEA